MWHPSYTARGGMLAAVELELLAAILDRGDLTLIQKGEFREEHCLSRTGKALHNFIANYKYVTEGNGRIPTRNVIQERFDNVELPGMTAPTVDMQALHHEVLVEAARERMREYALQVDDAANAIDPLAELAPLRGRLEGITSGVSKVQQYRFDTHLPGLEETYAMGNILPDGIPWPWPSVQKATRGMHKGEFIILSGRPKTRKTFIALYVAVTAYLQGARVLVFSPEMHPSIIIMRAAATAARLRYNEFKQGGLSPEELERFVDLVDVHGNPAYQDHSFTSSASISQAEDRLLDSGALFSVIKATNKPVSFIESEIEKYHPDIVLVDSFYRLTAEASKKTDSDVRTLTAISRGLKDAASEHEVVLLGTHQINRDGSKKIGDLTNLAYADAFGQDADLVFRALTAGKKTVMAMLGSRETDCQGVLINNIPCSDFTELAGIVDIEKAFKMLKKDSVVGTTLDDGSSEETDDDEDGEPSPRRKPPWGTETQRKKAASAKRNVERVKSAGLKAHLGVAGSE